MLRAVCGIAVPAGIVLAGAAVAGYLTAGVAAAAWAGIVLLGAGPALVHARDLRRLVQWTRTLRDNAPAPVPEAQSRSVRALAQEFRQVGHVIEGARSRAVESTRFAEGVLEALPMPVLALGADERVTHANAAAARLFGTPPPGHALPELTRVPECLRAAEAAARTGAVQAVECPLPAHDAALHQVVVYPVAAAAEGAPNRVMACVSRAAATPREEARNAFVANASHEFRTPLTAILGMVETLRGPARNDPEVQELYLERLDKQANRMVALVDGLIDLSAVEMSESLPPEGTVDLTGLARQAMEDLAPQAAAKTVDVRIEAPDEPVTVTGDAEQLRQLMTNLLSNAIKHGRPGGHAHLTVCPEPVRVLVTDDGDGLPPGEAERVFERFYRSAQARDRRVPGHGLGLAIVKHVARRHGAELAVESEPGAGCTFSVTFGAAGAPESASVTVT